MIISVYAGCALLLEKNIGIHMKEQLIFLKKGKLICKKYTDVAGVIQQACPQLFVICTAQSQNYESPIFQFESI